MRHKERGVNVTKGVLVLPHYYNVYLDLTSGDAFEQLAIQMMQLTSAKTHKTYMHNAT